MTTPQDNDLYFRQLRSGRDFAVGVPLAAEMANFVYVVGDRAAEEAILVDPTYDPAELVALVEADGLRVVGAFLTHYHADHAGGAFGGASIRGVADLLEVVDVPIHVQRSEVPWVTSETGLSETALRAHDPGDRLMVGDLAFTCVHTPGHTPGSQCLFGAGHLLTGDTLFLSGCGRTDLPGGDPDELYDSLMRRLGALDPATVVNPGHDYGPKPSATLGEVRATNGALAPVDRAIWRARFT